MVEIRQVNEQSVTKFQNIIKKMRNVTSKSDTRGIGTEPGLDGGVNGPPWLDQGARSQAQGKS